MMMCNHDCFNCVHDDCIDDNITPEEKKQNEEVFRACDRAESMKKRKSYQHNHTDSKKIARQKYDKSDKGKERQKRYNESEKGRERYIRYYNSEKYKNKKQKYDHEMYLRKRMETAIKTVANN